MLELPNHHIPQTENPNVLEELDSVIRVNLKTYIILLNKVSLTT